MAKIKSADIKLIICEHVRENTNQLSNEFVPAADMEPAQIAKNWKRREKYYNFSGDNRSPGRPIRVWVREFDCDPYDDQLRAYVETNYPEDTEVTFLEVIGE